MAKSNMTGAEFKALREKLGMSQREAARAVGVDYRAIKRWETWDAVPDKALALKDAAPLHEAVTEAEAPAEVETVEAEEDSDDSDGDGGTPAETLDFEDGEAVVVEDEAGLNEGVKQVTAQLKASKIARVITSSAAISRIVANRLAQSPIAKKGKLTKRVSHPDETRLLLTFKLA